MFLKNRSSYLGITEVWSPANVKLRTILERVQRHATRWILRARIGEILCKQRLLTLCLLPLTYDREIYLWIYRLKHWQIDLLLLSRMIVLAFRTLH